MSRRKKLNGNARALTLEPMKKEREAIRNDYSELVEKLKQSSPDWTRSNVSVDQDIYRNHLDLRDYSRDLWKMNPYLIAYEQELCTNVFGPCGIQLRMRVKELEDRVLYTPEERAVFEQADARRKEVLAYLSRKTGREVKAKQTVRIIKGKATIKVGELDVFANQLIERKWKEWQRKENCTVTGKLSYNESRQLRLVSCARDGGHFIRLVRNTKLFKPFGFKIQHINDEWCDYGYNDPQKNIRMGIEYGEFGEPMAYHFLKARPGQDWNNPPTRGMARAEDRVRIDASEIIHYARFSSNADVTRPAPWATAIMSTARQQVKYTEAAVIAARVGACSNVFFEADNGGPDGTTAAEISSEDMRRLQMHMNPGGMHGLPPGVRANVVNPNNPNANFGGFRNEILRELCAGLPGASFSVIGQNYAEINFSAGRLDRLSTTWAWMMLQQFDIDTAERPIFEAWLKMALTTGAIPLPVEKFDKFNKAVFTGRRWEGVDPVKEQNARAMAVTNNFTSWQRIHDEQGTDLEEVLFENAEAMMMMDQLGIDSSTTQGQTKATEPDAEDADETTEDDE